jgi:mannose-6-phosphate isomerase-like protein (cupin superfamily)
MAREATGLVLVGPADGVLVDLGGLGVHFKVGAEASAGRLSIVEHPMAPGRLVPSHVHHAEDELSYVLEGTFGVRIGDAEGTAGPGTYIYKPRGVPHTFWNPGPAPARLVEIISPAGFERFFTELAELVRRSSDLAAFVTARAALGERYGLGFLPDWDAELTARHQLKLLGAP